MREPRRFGAMQRGQAVVYLRREDVRGWPWAREWTVAAYDAPPDVETRPGRALLARARWNAHDDAKPRKGQRVVTLNQFRWTAVWCSDLKG
jgi:hypothetical protein